MAGAGTALCPPRAAPRTLEYPMSRLYGVLLPDEMPWLSRRLLNRERSPRSRIASDVRRRSVLEELPAAEQVTRRVGGSMRPWPTLRRTASGASSNAVPQAARIAGNLITARLRPGIAWTAHSSISACTNAWGEIAPQLALGDVELIRVEPGRSAGGTVSFKPAGGADASPCWARPSGKDWR